MIPLTLRMRGGASRPLTGGNGAGSEALLVVNTNNN